LSDSEHGEGLSLCDALLMLKSSKECANFLKDLCTPQELLALNERWRVCQLLARGDLSYREINELTGISLATIGRVARFLRDESYGGYRLILQRLKKGDSS